jgi:hypothetical protein
MSKKLRDWNQFKQQEASDRFSSEQQSLKSSELKSFGLLKSLATHPRVSSEQ